MPYHLAGFYLFALYIKRAPSLSHGNGVPVVTVLDVVTLPGPFFLNKPFGFFSDLESSFVCLIFREMV
jgi:hypothetical protein